MLINVALLMISYTCLAFVVNILCVCVFLKHLLVDIWHWNDVSLLLLLLHVAAAVVSFVGTCLQKSASSSKV